MPDAGTGLLIVTVAAPTNAMVDGSAVVMVNGGNRAPGQHSRVFRGVVTAGVGRSALTGWIAGAHVPAIQLSSLPLDEWPYMRHNDAVRFRLRPAR